MLAWFDPSPPFRIVLSEGQRAWFERKRAEDAAKNAQERARFLTRPPSTCAMVLRGQ